MSQVTVVTALRMETRAILAVLARPARLAGGRCPSWRGVAGGNQVVVVQSGVGPAAAARVVAALPGETDLLLSIGFAGALVAELEPGDLVLPAAVSWQEGAVTRRYAVPPVLHAAARAVLAGALGRPVAHGTLLSSPVVIAGTAAKRSAAERHGAVAVEMETAALVAHAERCGLPLLALRAVLDPVDLSLERLPPDVETSWAARARLLATPGVWPLAAALRRYATIAASALTGAAGAVLPALDPPAHPR